MSRVRLALLLAVAVTCSAFAADSSLTVKDPYVRLAPPGTQVTGAYMIIRNTGKTDRQLLSAESPVARTVELHNHTNDNGVMTMRQVQSIEIKANAQAELKPGSFHIMLIDVKKALREDDRVPITLSFDDGSKQQIDAPVRKVQTTMPADKGMDHGGMKH